MVFTKYAVVNVYLRKMVWITIFTLFLWLLILQIFVKLKYRLNLRLSKIKGAVKPLIFFQLFYCIVSGYRL